MWKITEGYLFFAEREVRVRDEGAEGAYEGDASGAAA
jgi:hypothetical protein